MNRWTVWLGAARRRVEGAGELVATAKLKAILQKEARGDTNVVVRPATVENLAAVRGYGVLIFKGHGLEGANIAP